MKSLWSWFLRDRIFKSFSIFLNPEQVLQSPKNYKKWQNTVLTKHGVIWKISKSNKKHAQGMEMGFFVVCLKICIGGVCSEMRMGVCVFGNGGFFWEVCEFTFEIRLKINFKNFILWFRVLKFKLYLQSNKSAHNKITNLTRKPPSI